MVMVVMVGSSAGSYYDGGGGGGGGAYASSLKVLRMPVVHRGRTRCWSVSCFLSNERWRSLLVVVGEWVGLVRPGLTRYLGIFGILLRFLVESR